jgi:thioesterase domain-containing protein/acyl carrier protein
MIPSSFTFVAALPLTPSGKVDRRALATSASAAVISEGLAAEIVPPRDELELLLANLWEEVLDVRPIGIRNGFFALGHSLLAVRLAALIRSRFGFELPLAAFFQAPTVEAMAELLRERGSLPPRSVLVQMSRGVAGRPPFFCIHPIGGNVLAYAELAQRLESVPFYGLQSLDPVKGSLGSLEAMAEHYLTALRTVQPEGPYRLGGWSMGGAVAYEMARRIVAMGERVELLALIDSAAQTTDVEPPPSDLMLFARFAGDLARLSGLEIPAGSLAGATIEEALADLVAQAEVAGILPPGLDAEALGGLFEVFRSNYRALAAYRPLAWTGRLTLFRARAHTDGDPTLGWARLATEGVEVYEVPGNHYSLLRGEGVRVLADRLRRLLEG